MSKFSRKLNMPTRGIRIGAVSDVEAKLICTKEPDGQWSCMLTEIKGNKVAFLLGREYDPEEELDLNSLIPPSYRAQHRKQMSDVLEHGSASKYWNRLFDGHMTRTLRLVNPVDQSARLAKIKMWCDSDNSTTSMNIFHVELVDDTTVNMVANKAGALTHDLRGYLRSGLNIISERQSKFTREEFSTLSPEILGRLYDEIEDQDSVLTEILSEGLRLCGSSRQDFLPEAFLTHNWSPLKAAEKEKKTLYIELRKMVGKLLMSLKDCKISLSVVTNLSLDGRVYDAMDRLLVNLIRNAKGADANDIFVHCFDENGHLTCTVTDNGKGMSNEELEGFFTRTLPTLPNDYCKRNIEANRGEGTLMAFAEWELLGGTASASARCDNMHGVVMKIHLKAHHFNGRQPDDPIFNVSVKTGESTPNSVHSHSSKSAGSGGGGGCPFHHVFNSLSTTSSMDSAQTDPAPNSILSHGILTKPQVQRIDNFINSPYFNLNHTILLIDDSLVNIKLLSKSICNFLLKFNYISNLTNQTNEIQSVKPQIWGSSNEVFIDRIYEDYSIIYCSNGVVAFEIIKILYQSFLLIICDYEMPQISGLELIKKVGALENSKIKNRFILHTALNYTDFQAFSKFGNLNCDFLMKGSNQAILEELLHKNILK